MMENNKTRQLLQEAREFLQPPTPLRRVSVSNPHHKRRAAICSGSPTSTIPSFFSSFAPCAPDGSGGDEYTSLLQGGEGSYIAPTTQTFSARGSWANGSCYGDFTSAEPDLLEITLSIAPGEDSRRNSSLTSAFGPLTPEGDEKLGASSSGGFRLEPIVVRTPVTSYVFPTTTASSVDDNLLRLPRL